jgi:hypothetical protein
MAIENAPEQIALNLKKEVAATSVVLGRLVQKNPETGAIEVIYPVTINYGFVTYELDAEGNKTDVYGAGDMGSFRLPPEELQALWMIPVTLEDGTQTVLAEVIANATDAAIQSRL